MQDDRIVKVRIKVWSFNPVKLINTATKIIDKIHEIRLMRDKENHNYNDINLPTKKRIYCILRSPHVA
jgi:ribosomal protein S10